MRLLQESKSDIMKFNEVITEHKVDKAGKQYQVSYTVRQALESKHPASREASLETIRDLKGSERFHEIIFDQIDQDFIRKCVLQTHGAAGTSGADAFHWKRICTAFKEKSNSLCDALAVLTQGLATQAINPLSLQALVASRLIGLNKNPGVRPIGVGEIIRRVSSKAIIRVASNDLLSCTVSQ